MAMTEAEKKRVQRARKKAELRNAPNEAHSYFKEPFSEFMNRDDVRDNFDQVSTPLELLGYEAPAFDDERGPMDFADPNTIAGVPDPFPYAADDAIGRAHVFIECLLDAAEKMAGFANAYEREQLEARLKELESSSEADRATAMKEAVRLNKMLDQLSKRVRRDFPQWKVTGV